MDDRTIGALQRSVKGGIEGYIEDRLALGDSTDCLFSVCSISHTSRVFRAACLDRTMQRGGLGAARIQKGRNAFRSRE